MDIISVISSILSLLPLVITSVSTYSVCYILFKRKLKEVREAIDVLDDALQDDKISEEEFRVIWNKFKAIIIN
jgi:uncharacterized membrane protein